MDGVNYKNITTWHRGVRLTLTWLVIPANKRVSKKVRAPMRYESVHVRSDLNRQRIDVNNKIVEDIGVRVSFSDNGGPGRGKEFVGVHGGIKKSLRGLQTTVSGSIESSSELVDSVLSVFGILCGIVGQQECVEVVISSRLHEHATVSSPTSLIQIDANFPGPSWDMPHSTTYKIIGLFGSGSGRVPMLTA